MTVLKNTPRENKIHNAAFYPEVLVQLNEIFIEFITIQIKKLKKWLHDYKSSIYIYELRSKYICNVN